MHFPLLRTDEGMSLFLLFIDIIDAVPGFPYIFNIFLETRREVYLVRVLKTPYPSAPVRCVPVASPADSSDESVSLVLSFASPTYK